MSSLEAIDLSVLIDLPEGVVQAITDARLEFATIAADRETEATTLAIERETERITLATQFETERANNNRRIRGLEDALGALSTRPDEHPSAFTDLPPATGTYNDLVGDFLLAERTDIELETSIMQIVSKAERLRLSATDKGKLYTAFVKGSTSKFKATSTIVGLDEISTIENISSFEELRIELQKHITSISVHPVFLILKFDPDGNLIDPDSEAGAPINLLSVNILPPLAEIERSMNFYHRRGSTFNRENLAWSLEAVRNSCDKELQVILDAKMLRYKASERFGPLYYYELVRQMTDVDSKAIRGITQELTALKVTDQEGQSIAKTASIIRSTLIWLEMVKMVPPDIDAIVLDILETCTVPDFALYLKTLSTNASLNGVILTYVELLERTENHYRTLVITKKWDAVGHQGSSFQAQRVPTSSRTNENPRPRVNMPSWSRTPPPTDTEPHERTFETTLFKWCAICQRWFFGHRAHLTDEHTPGHPSRGRRPTTSSTPVANTPSSSAHLAAAAPTADPPLPDVPTPSGLSRTYFTGGL
ncbi:hypothetical protein MHU86_14614 [Fragilaria crotonensis]|nr:hypothetical protein MHU86_14614 [Fragilaria crotonensis]